MYHILKPYGSTKADERLNIVLNQVDFNNIREFEAHLRELVGKFDSREPHLFLFGEAPFPERYVPPAGAVKRMVKRISALLKEKHPASAVAFSVFENSPGTNKRSYIANNGYLIHASGHRFYPKVKLTPVDRAHSGLAYKDQAIWDEVAAVRKRRSSFPTHVFSTGHEVMFKVCADATIPASNANGQILVVSAQDYGEGDFLHLKNHKLAVVNDGLASFVQHGTSRVLTDFGNTHQSTLQKLSAEKIRIHNVI